MALQLSGKCLKVETRTVQGSNGSFVSTELHILDDVRVERVRVGRDFDQATLPKDGDDVVLEVAPSAFARRDGSAGYQFTAIRSLKSAAHLRPASNS